MKSVTFTQMYVHLVFAVKNREALLNKSFRNRVFEYVGGIITGLKHKSIIVNGALDHVHILFGLNPSVNISDTVHDVKRGSSLFINDQKFLNGHFSWQEGYGAFTYGQSQLNDIYKYIKNQELHHQKTSFREEYISILKKFEIGYDARFLFDFIDTNP
jgi:REP element-mobilizing transposase RayT